jgi:hypothetical protein
MVPTVFSLVRDHCKIFHHIDDLQAFPTFLTTKTYRIRLPHVNIQKVEIFNMDIENKGLAHPIGISKLCSVRSCKRSTVRSTIKPLQKGQHQIL